MIERRDYLMAQIEAMGKLIAKMVRQVKRNEPDEVTVTFNECLELLGYTSGSIYTYDPIEVIRSIRNPDVLNMLTEAVDVYLSINDDEWASRLRAASARRMSDEKTVPFSRFFQDLTDGEV